MRGFMPCWHVPAVRYGGILITIFFSTPSIIASEAWFWNHRAFEVSDCSVICFGVFWVVIFWKNLFFWTIRLSFSAYSYSHYQACCGIGIFTTDTSIILSVVAVCMWLASFLKGIESIWWFTFLWFLFSKYFFYAKITVCFLLFPFSCLFVGEKT